MNLSLEKNSRHSHQDLRDVNEVQAPSGPRIRGVHVHEVKSSNSCGTLSGTIC